MIPRVIHYIWFGNNTKSDEILACIESWKEKCPDFVIKEWNELNFPVERFPFTSRCYNEKKWAFVSDYARLHILYEEGGFYLDTDMLLLQSLNTLLENECVLGEETKGTISAGVIGCTPKHPFIFSCRRYYDENPAQTITIPRVISGVFEKYENKSSLKVYPPKTFYPFSAENIKEWVRKDLGPDVIGVHLWNYSWGHPLNKFFKKIGIYYAGKRLLEILGLKNMIKKVFGFI